VQHPDDPTGRGTSDEPRSSSSIKNRDQLTSHDARVLMSLSGNEAKEERIRSDWFLSDEAMAVKKAANQPPPTGSREMRDRIRCELWSVYSFLSVAMVPFIYL
jgi:hypothetical protein